MAGSIVGDCRLMHFKVLHGLDISFVSKEHRRVEVEGRFGEVARRRRRGDRRPTALLVSGSPVGIDGRSRRPASSTFHHLGGPRRGRSPRSARREDAQPGAPLGVSCTSFGGRRTTARGRGGCRMP